MLRRMTKNLVRILFAVLLIFAPLASQAGSDSKEVCWESKAIAQLRPELPTRLCAELDVALNDSRNKGALVFNSVEFSGVVSVQKTFIGSGGYLLKSDTIHEVKAEETACFDSWRGKLHLEARTNGAGELLESWQLVAEIYNTEDVCHSDYELTKVIRYNVAE